MLFSKKIQLDSEFKKNTTLDHRLNYSTKLSNKFPDCVPVIIKKNTNDKILQDIDKEKYLIPKNLKLHDVLLIIRRRIVLDPKQAIFIFVGSGVLVPMNQDIQTLYDQYKSDDNFLYLVYTAENTFG